MWDPTGVITGINGSKEVGDQGALRLAFQTRAPSSRSGWAMSRPPCRKVRT